MQHPRIPVVVDYVPYLIPTEEQGLTESDCIDIDRKNEEIHRYNQQYSTQLNQLLAKLSLPSRDFGAPPKYTPDCKKRYADKVRSQKWWGTTAAIEYLTKNYKLSPKDYPPNYTCFNALELANKLTSEHHMRTHLAQTHPPGTVFDVTHLHRPDAQKPTCKKEWDGKSARCTAGCTGDTFSWTIDPLTHVFCEPPKITISVARQ
jgi:hypothetical protein